MILTYEQQLELVAKKLATEEILPDRWKPVVKEIVKLFTKEQWSSMQAQARRKELEKIYE